MTRTMTNTTAPSIVADIGGTNTRVALARGASLVANSIRRFRNADYPGLEPILRAYLDTEGVTACTGACVAAAGPVRDGVAEMTNLAWTMTNASIAEATGATTVSLLNDLQAQGQALGHLDDAALRPIITAPDAGPKASRLVIGVGTGFNAAPVHQTSHGRHVAASECGHVSLAVHHPDDRRLMDYIETIPEVQGFASVEDVLSGRGLERVDDWVAFEAGTRRDRTAADIMHAIAGGTEPQARSVAETFVRILGVTAGNLALIHLPFGGIYLCGGVARAFAPYLEPFGFERNFCEKGRLSDFMTGFPVSIIEDDYAALRGCAVHLAHLNTRT